MTSIVGMLFSVAALPRLLPTAESDDDIFGHIIEDFKSHHGHALDKSSTNTPTPDPCDAYPVRYQREVCEYDQTHNRPWWRLFR